MSEICLSARLAGRYPPLFRAPELTGDVDVDVARAVGLDVAKVTNVTLGVGGTAVILTMRVEMRAGRSTTVAIVTKSYVSVCSVCVEEMLKKDVTNWWMWKPGDVSGCSRWRWRSSATRPQRGSH